MNVTIGVLALQGAFFEHIVLLKRAAQGIKNISQNSPIFGFVEVRTAAELSKCDALVIPGGESTTIALIAADSGLLEPLRDFVKCVDVHFIEATSDISRLNRKPTWGTCAGLILLAESANRVKKGGQELIGGLDVRVNRNHFGRQVESFQADLSLPFLSELPGSNNVPFPGVFIRAPVVEKLLPNTEGPQVEEDQKADTIVAPSRVVENESAKKRLARDISILGTLPGRVNKTGNESLVSAAGETGDIIAVQQGNVFGTSFHPELTTDTRIHQWWLLQVLEILEHSK